MKFYNQVLLFIFLVCNCFVISAQESDQLHYLHLKDGSFLKGFVQESQSDTIKFKLISGEVLTIASDNISKLKLNRKKVEVLDHGETISKEKFYHIALVGLLASKNDLWGGFNYGISFPHYVFGKRFNQFLNVGLGVGMDSYNYEFAPIYLDLRGYINKKKFSPYYALNAGYAFAFDLFNNWEFQEVAFKGGLMIHPALGIQVATRQNFNLLFEVGIKFQNGEIQYKNQDFVDDWTHRRISFRIGLVF